MIVKKCPLCSGTVSNGQCIDCGYILPDKNELEIMSGLYDFDPDDYPDPEKYLKKAERPVADPPETETYNAEVISSEELPAAPKPPPLPPDFGSRDRSDFFLFGTGLKYGMMFLGAVIIGMLIAMLSRSDMIRILFGP